MATAIGIAAIYQGKRVRFRNAVDLISYLHEKTSLIITNNLNFAEWVQVFCDAKITTALPDSLQQLVDSMRLDQ